MRITPINNTQYHKTKFGSCFRTYAPKTIKTLDTFDKGIVRTSTNLFRDDLDWLGLIKYIKTHFTNKSKVNMYSLASSDGSEAYSLAISIKEKMEHDNQEKFLPITACDIDKEVINVANKRRINIYNIEFFMAEKNYDINIEKYFKNKSVSVMINNDITSESDTISSFEPIKELQDAVKYKNIDILTALNELEDDGNTVILCRNVFPYLSINYTDKVIQSARNKLKDGSLFIIGDYDGYTDIEEKLAKNGFFQPILNNGSIYSCNIFQRGSYKEITNKLYSGYII